MQETVKINPAEIPAVEVRLLCRTLAASMKQFYSDPQNLSRFKSWQRAQAEREATP